jgi:hypothetical protein
VSIPGESDWVFKISFWFYFWQTWCALGSITIGFYAYHDCEQVPFVGECLKHKSPFGSDQYLAVLCKASNDVMHQRD